MKKLKSEIKIIGDTILRNWTVLFCFEIIYQTIHFVVILPLFRILIQKSFNSYIAVLVNFICFLFESLYIYYQISVLFLYSEKSWKRENITFRSLCREAAVKTCALFRLKCLPAFLFLLAMILSFLFFTSGFLKISIYPSLIRMGKDGPLEIIFFIGFFLLTPLFLLFYLFGFPGLFIEEKTFSHSWKENRLLMRKNLLPVAGKFLVYILLFYIFTMILFAIGTLLLAEGIRLFCDPESYRVQFQLYFLPLQSFWGMISAALLPVFLCSVVIVLYHKHKGDFRPEEFRQVPIQKKHAFRILILSILIFSFIFPAEFQNRSRTFLRKKPSVRVVAHRAGAALAPENTIAALRQAIKAGIMMAEIDVQQLKDGTLIIMHDMNFKRITGVDLNLRDADYEMVKKMDAGSFFSSAFAGERIPTLEEMLCAAKNKIKLMIELKAGGYKENIEEKTLKLVEKYDMKEQCVIASMDMDTLERVKELEPDIQTVYISANLCMEQYPKTELDAYSMKADVLPKSLVKEMHRKKKPIFAWTVNSEEEMRKYLTYAIDGLITDHPILAEFCIRGGKEILPVEKLTDFLFPRQN